MTVAVTFTPAACAYIRKVMAKESGVGFRLTVKKTGCSGYSYLPAIITAINSKDIVLKIEDLNIYIDTTWQHLFNDITVDYLEEEKAGLKQKRLVFINPNEASRCGCGESFTI